MNILVTNDDGIYAPGLEALAKALRRLGEVQIVAPLSEQSGVGHSITYLTPLLARRVMRDQHPFGHAVAGSPADCVKLAVLELCPQRPDLVVSGINSGSNAGIDVLYSGTVAAAIEGAFFGITSCAVSHAVDTDPDYDQAAIRAVQIIEDLLHSPVPVGSLWNINLPDRRLWPPRGIKVLPISVERSRDVMIRRTDPRGRAYYWSAVDDSEPLPLEPDTDLSGLAEGFITVTPLQFNLTHRPLMQAGREIAWRPLPPVSGEESSRGG